MVWLVKFFLVTTSFQFPTSLESCCAIKLSSLDCVTKGFLVYKTPVKTCDSPVQHPGAMQSAHSFLLYLLLSPQSRRDTRHPCSPKPSSGIHPLQLLLTQGLQFAMVISYSWQRLEKWPQSITTLVTESPTVWSRTSKSYSSSALVTADICVTCSPAYPLNHFFSKQMKSSLMFLSQLFVTDYCSSFINQDSFRKQLVEIPGCRGPYGFPEATTNRILIKEKHRPCKKKKLKQEQKNSINKNPTRDN